MPDIYSDQQLMAAMESIFPGLKQGISLREAYKIILKETRRLKRIETKYKSKRQRCKGCA